MTALPGKYVPSSGEGKPSLVRNHFSSAQARRPALTFAFSSRADLDPERAEGLLGVLRSELPLQVGRRRMESSSPLSHVLIEFKEGEKGCDVEGVPGSEETGTPTPSPPYQLGTGAGERASLPVAIDYNAPGAGGEARNSPSLPCLVEAITKDRPDVL